jgi:hypothetical protein
MGKLKSSHKVWFFIVNLYVYVKVWGRPICIRGILYFKLNGIDAINEITKRRNI